MRRGPQTLVALLATLLLLLSSISLASAQSNTTVVVRPEDLSNGSWEIITYNLGSFQLVDGPATPPLGSGSAELETVSGTDGVLLENLDFAGTLLSDIQDISYSTYRSSASTSSDAQYPYIWLSVIYGPDIHQTFLWEPVYAYGQANLQSDTWQTWDAMATSQTANGGGWWSSSNAGSYMANTYVSWSTLVSDLGQGATVESAIGLAAGDTVGNPWDGAFTGNVDALKIATSSGATTYNFENYVPAPTQYSQCYFGGWQNFDNPPFSSQAQCSAYVAAYQLRQYYCSRFSLPVCEDAVIPAVK